MQKIEDPDYDGQDVSWHLSENATPVEKAKYELCEKILGYQQDNNISDQNLKKMLEIKEKKRLECLLFAHIENFSLDELFAYAERLTIPLQVVNNNEEKVIPKFYNWIRL